jgi:putative ABC transport system permease protein
MFWRKRKQSDFTAEIEAHLELETERLREQGLSEEEARRAARRAFGNLTRAQERFYESGRWLWWDHLVQDLRFGLRMLRKNPGFTAVVVMTLALGIGSTTAMFTVIDGVLLRPLPLPNSEQLMAIRGLTEPEMIDPLVWWGHNRSFGQLANWFSGGVNLSWEGRGERTPAAVVSANFFAVLGVRPILGRGFIADEETPGNSHVAVLGYGLWTEMFGNDRGVLTRSVRLNGIPHIIVGVMPPGFSFPGRTRVWVPRTPALLGRGSLDFGSDPSGLPTGRWTIGRLQAGVSRIQAEVEMTALSRQLQKQYGNERHIVANEYVQVKPLQEAIVGSVRPALLALFAAILFVLLIACANAANMLLARATVRRKEIAVRFCLGASRLRVVVQLLTESFVLAIVAGVLGFLLALWFVDAIQAITPANLPRVEDIRVDPRVLLFTLGVSSLTGVLVGLAPALQTLTPEITRALKGEGYRSTGGMHAAVRGALVIGELSLALLLLTGAGLMSRSLYRLTGIELGFNPQNVLTMEIALPKAKYAASAEIASVQEKQKDEARSSASLQEVPKGTRAVVTDESLPTSFSVFQQRLLEEIGSVPGVVGVGTTNNLPLKGGAGGVHFDVQGIAKGEARLFEIGGDYFRAMGIPLVAGRTFTASDTGTAPKVVIVSHSLARGVWGNRNPVGDQFVIEGEEAPREMVGVAQDVTSVEDPNWGQWQFYLPQLQGYRMSRVRPLDMTLVVRTSSDPKEIIPALRSRVFALDKDLPVFNVKNMEEVFSQYVAPERFRGLLFGLFAFLGLTLAGVGVYGVAAYSAALRTHEIGIRMCLGAQPRDVLLMILSEGLRRALVGISLGLLAAMALKRFISGLLFGISAADPTTYIWSAAVLFAVTLAGSYIPARRATKVKPMTALRNE